LVISQLIFRSKSCSEFENLVKKKRYTDQEGSGLERRGGGGRGCGEAKQTPKMDEMEEGQGRREMAPVSNAKRVC